MIIGLTGGIGAGKSTVANLFKSYGVPIIDSDEITHQILNNDKVIQQAIVKKFGDQCLNTDNTINRKELRKIIFANQQDKYWLEELLHPIIAKAFIERTKNCHYPYCIIEIPLLVEAGMQDMVDRILTIDCSKEQQLERALSRGKHSELEIKAIIANQITRKQRITESNDIIENTSDLTNLKSHIEELHNLYLSLAAKNML